MDNDKYYIPDLEEIFDTDRGIPDLIKKRKIEKTNEEILLYFSSLIKKEMNEEDIVAAWEKYKEIHKEEINGK